MFYHGGKQIETVQLTALPILEPISKMPDSDFEAEGFAYLESIGSPIPDAFCKHFKKIPSTWREAFELWRETDVSLYVVRFDYPSDPQSLLF